MHRHIGLTAVFLALAFQAASAAESAPAATSSAPAPDPELPARIALIRRQLASDDFAQRDAGQKLLDLIPPAQSATLRALAAKETDPEVKARLDARIDAMELYLLVHPPPLSLHVKNANLTDVALELRRQIGDAATIVGTTAGSFTLDANDRPFWEIFAQLNQQTPLSVASSISITAAGTTSTLRLTTGAAREYKIIDTFAIWPQLSGTPATGSWGLRVQGFADPRVRISQYSQLRIEKITDQDGNSLLPFLTSNAAGMNSSVRPVNSWPSSASFSAVPGLHQIKELRAAITLSILESEQTITLDLTKPLAPIDSGRGQITVEKNAAGGFVIHIIPVPNPSDSVPRPSPVLIRTTDIAGRSISSYTTTALQVNYQLPANAAPAEVQISWPDKTRDMVLPIELKDFALPAAAIRPAVVPAPL